MRPLFFVLALILAGCAGTTDQQKNFAVRQRASYDLNCDADKIEVTYLQSNTYGAKGCKQQQNYVTEGTMVYKEGMQPVRNYYNNRPSFGVGVGVGHGFGRYYY